MTSELDKDLHSAPTFQHRDNGSADGWDMVTGTLRLEYV